MVLETANLVLVLILFSIPILLSWAIIFSFGRKINLLSRRIKSISQRLERLERRRERE